MQMKPWVDTSLGAGKEVQGQAQGRVARKQCRGSWQSPHQSRYVHQFGRVRIGMAVPDVVLSLVLVQQCFLSWALILRNKLLGGEGKVLLSSAWSQEQSLGVQTLPQLGAGL